MSESSAPEDASFLERLRKDLEDWQKEGLVHPDQAQAILARYGLVPGETVRTLHRSKLVSIIAVLGVILVGVGVILLIGANWQHISKLSRLALLILVTAASYAAGYRMAYDSQKYPKVGMALLLLGSLLWGASIFLIGQMYHSGGGGGEVKAVLYWFIGVFPLAYVLLSPLHLALSLVLGSIWLLMVMSRNYEVGSQMYIFLVFGLGILLYAIGRFHAMWQAVRRIEIPYRWLGLIYLLAALYAFSFRGFWRPEYWATYDGARWVWPGVLLAAGMAAAIGLLITQARRERAAVYEALALAFLAVLGGAIVAMWFTRFGSGKLPEEVYSTPVPLWIMALSNLLLLLAEIGLIALGWFRNQPGLANLGIFVFFVQVLTRYFDLLGSMLSGGLMFIGAGLLLVLGGVFLERSRRRLLDAMAQRRSA